MDNLILYNYNNLLLRMRIIHAGITLGRCGYAWPTLQLGCTIRPARYVGAATSPASSEAVGQEGGKEEWDEEEAGMGRKATVTLTAFMTNVEPHFTQYK